MAAQIWPSIRSHPDGHSGDAWSSAVGCRQFANGAVPREFYGPTVGPAAVVLRVQVDERLSLNFPELRAFRQLTEAGMERADATRVAGFSNSARGTETAYLIRLEIRSFFVSTIPAEMRFSGPGMRFWSVCFARTSWIAFSRSFLSVTNSTGGGSSMMSQMDCFSGVGSILP